MFRNWIVFIVLGFSCEIGWEIVKLCEIGIKIMGKLI